MFCKRDILSKLEKELVTREIVVITGMRQVGKTTLLQYLFDKVNSTNKVMLDLGNPLHRKIFEEENFDNVWVNLREFGINNKSKAFIFLDEIQNLPVISQVVKYLYDHNEVKFILTGSSSFYLKNLFPESLSGRKVVYEVFPLTFNEFLYFNKVERKTADDFVSKAKEKNKLGYERLVSYYEEYQEYGGFPAVVLENDPARKKLLLESIFTSYFEMDVKSLSDFKNLSDIRDLILTLIPRIGSKIEIAKLASELSLSRTTIYSFLSFLEATYFISLLPKFSKSIDRQVSGGKKLFICDSGLANVLGKVSRGQLFEQSVFQNLRPIHKLSYYSGKRGGEVDFVVDGKICLEAKVSASGKDFSGLIRKAGSLKIKDRFVVSLRFDQRNLSIPATSL